MNKLIIAGLFFAGIATATAQQHPVTKVEVVKTETPKQAVHNVFHPKHKRYSGVKIKKKTRHGRKVVKTIDHRNHTMTVKTKHAGSPDKHEVTVPIKK